MAAYVPITDAQTDPGAPGTSELWKQWRDNPIAIAEGSSGAPKIAVAASGGTSSGGVFTSVDLAVFGGAVLHGGFRVALGGNQLILQLSDDGVTYYGNQILHTSGGGADSPGTFNISVNFINGAYIFQGFVNNVASLTGGTIPGSSLAARFIRLTATGGATPTVSALVIANGGQQP